MLQHLRCRPILYWAGPLYMGQIFIWCILRYIEIGLIVQNICQLWLRFKWVFGLEELLAAIWVHLFVPSQAKRIQFIMRNITHFMSPWCQNKVLSLSILFRHVRTSFFCECTDFKQWNFIWVRKSIFLCVRTLT